MEYNFKGLIKSYKGYSLPFIASDARLRLDVSSLSFGEVNRVDVNGNIIFTNDIPFCEEYLEGITDEGKFIKLHIKQYYDLDNSFFDMEKHHIGGVVSSCIVLDGKNYKDSIDKVSFFSYYTSKILGHHVSGGITENQLELLGFNKNIASYVENNNKYYVLHDFLNKEPFCHSQTISVKSDKALTIVMLEDIYWTMRKFFAFIFQVKDAPIFDITLHNDAATVGHLFIKQSKAEPEFLDRIKCLQISSWKDKLSNLFQALVDKKIYLRHLPDLDSQKREYSASRFLVTIIGFESALDALNIKADYSEEHRKAIDEVKKEINFLKDRSENRYEKKEYSSILNNLEYDRLECRYGNAFKQNEEYIKNFYVFSNLGESIQEVAKGLAHSRNNFAHGNLDEDLSWKHANYCDFLDLFILYLQLLYIGVPKDIAYVTVPQIMFER